MRIVNVGDVLWQGQALNVKDAMEQAALPSSVSVRTMGGGLHHFSIKSLPGRYKVEALTAPDEISSPGLPTITIRAHYRVVRIQ
jgi:hypothetical protein